MCVVFSGPGRLTGKWEIGRFEPISGRLTIADDTLGDLTRRIHGLRKAVRAMIISMISQTIHWAESPSYAQVRIPMTPQ